MRTVLSSLTILLAASVLGACGSSGGSTATTAPPATGTDATATTGVCRAVAAPRAGRRTAPRPTAADRLPPSPPTVVTMQTSCGPLTIRLAVREQPRTAASFAALVRERFYDGLTFHRISAPGQEFVVQGGDPLGTGMGGPGWTITEKPPADATYPRGTVAMAKTETEPAGTSGSQFFIVTAPDAGLPPDYAIAGRLVDGDQTLTRIAAVPADAATERPRSPVVIESATVSGG